MYGALYEDLLDAQGSESSRLIEQQSPGAGGAEGEPKLLFFKVLKYDSIYCFTDLDF